MSNTSQKNGRGVSLRRTFMVMLLVSLVLTAFLLLSAFRTITSFHKLSAATEDYIELQEAADRLMKASDYLTDEARCYTMLGERIHMDNYFYEALTARHREMAIKTMEERLPGSEALEALKGAMAESVALMDREYYSMRLVLLAQGDGYVPDVLKEVKISLDDLALPPEEKIELARKMMHDSEYYSKKNKIRSNMSKCIRELKEEMSGTQNLLNVDMKNELLQMTVLIAVQSLAIILLLWVMTNLGINPVLQAVEHIKRDQELPITGSNEFRYLASTYNTIYASYKKNIDNLSFRASHDELTGVYNRSGYELLRDTVDMNTTAFLLFDADKFKYINDEYGHEVGDRVLKKIAATLVDNFRDDDYICRIGGDEFMVIMVHVSKDVKRLIENKVTQINHELADTKKDGLPPISVSTGVALCWNSGDPQEIFHDADVALYRVKDQGGSNCCFYEPEIKNA